MKHNPGFGNSNVLFILDLYISCKNDIKVGYFHGDKLYLESQNGDINIDKFQGDVVRLITHTGNINIKEYMQASDVDAAIMNAGVRIKNNYCIA